MVDLNNYAIIPLDVKTPPVNIEDLQRFLQNQCHACAFDQNRIRYILFFARESNPSRIFDPVTYKMKMEDKDFSWNGNFKAAFGSLVTWFERLPFLELHGIDFITQTDDIPEHMDIYGNNNSETYFRKYSSIEPRYYRVIFASTKDSVVRKRSFYITQKYKGRKRFLELPSTTSAFAMNSACCYHGAKYNPGYFKTTAAIFGVLDEERHLSLLERSLKKYYHSAIRLRHANPVSGPGAELPYRAPHESAK